MNCNCPDRGVYDVVMDEGRALVVAFADGTQQQLAVDVCLKDILQCLADAREIRLFLRSLRYPEDMFHIQAPNTA